MHFLILTQYYEPEIGAPQSRLGNMTKELLQKGHSVEVVTAMPNYPSGHIQPAYQGKFSCTEVKDGIRIHRTWLHASMGRGSARMLGYLSFTATAFWSLLKVRRPDVVFIESPPLTLGVPGILYAKLRRCKSVFNVADLWPDFAVEIGALKSRFLIYSAQLLEQFCYHFADLVCSPVQGVLDRIRDEKGFPQERLSFLPNGVDTNFFRPDVKPSDLTEGIIKGRKKLIVYAGTLGYFQGLDTVIRAFEHLEKLDPSIHLLLVGDGSEHARLVKLTRDLNLNNVSFLPPQLPSEVARIYGAARAGLVSLADVPSARICRPSKIWQIMASEKPIIYVGEGEGADIVQNSESGVVLRPNDPEKIAQGIQALMKDPEKATMLGKRGRHYAVTEFSWSSLMDTWLRDLQGKLPSQKRPRTLGRPDPQVP